MESPRHSRALKDLPRLQDSLALRRIFRRSKDFPAFEGRFSVQKHQTKALNDFSSITRQSRWSRLVIKSVKGVKRVKSGWKVGHSDMDAEDKSRMKRLFGIAELSTLFLTTIQVGFEIFTYFELFLRAVSRC